MGRTKIVEDGKVTSVRLPNAFLKTKPSKYKNYGDWLRDMLLNNAEIPAQAGNNGLNPEEKHALTFFYELFNHLFESGKLDDVIAEKPDLLDNVAALEKVIKNHV